MRKITCLALLFGLLFSFQNAVGQTDAKDYKSYPYWIDMMQDPNANFFETQKAFYEYWEGKEVTKGSGYKLFKRWEYWMGKEVAPDGTKPSPYRTINAIKETQLKNSSRTTEGNWVTLGPASVPSGYNGYRGLGRVNAVGFHPTDPNTVYIGAPAGGLWITHDGGATWTSNTDNMPTLGVSAVIVDHTNPNIIYIGTGDRDAGDAAGLGVWKSMDGGLTFQAINTGMQDITVSRLMIHPTNNNIIIAATNGGIYRSENGGTVWTKTANGNFKDVVFNAADPNIVYAASAGNFYRSTNNGVSFIQITAGLPGGSRGAIAVSPANPNYVYFFITNSESFKGLYRSTDSGLTFTVRSTSPNIMSWGCDGGSGGQAWYDLDMACDPTNAEVIYGGGVNCFKSTNGGTSWSINSHWWGDCGVPSVHADLHVLEYNPLNNRLYAGNDGGVYWTDNGGTSWNEISNGLVISQAYKIGQSATNRNYVINGYQDNGTSSFTGPEWVSVGGGDGMECAYDPTDDVYSYSTVYYGSIDRHQNHGYDGNIAGNGVNGITESGGWVTPFIIDHNDGNIMFIGYDNIWRSTNIKTFYADQVVFEKISNMSVSDFEVLAQSDANTDILYIADANKLWRSDNVKAPSVEWTNLTANLPTGLTITAVETSPSDENVVFIVMQNRVFRSGNKGQSWEELTGNLPDVQMNTLVYYHNSPEGLYLGTNMGVFYRDLFNTEWIFYSDGLPASAKITELEIFYDAQNPQNDVLRAGTYGRGLWETSLRFTQPSADFVADNVIVPLGCPVNFSDQSVGIPFEWNWQFEGGIPATSAEQHPQGIIYNQAGQYTVTLIVSNPAGTDTITKTAYITASSTLMPETEFTSSLHAFCEGEAAIVSFFDLTDNCPSSWQWSFEPDNVAFLQGTSATSQNPVVLFPGEYNYDVTLTSTNANGSTTTVKENYVVKGGMALPFSENWDNGEPDSNGWEIVNPDDLKTWEIYSITTDSTPNKVARMNFFGYNVAPGRRDQLISPPMNFDGYNNAYLSFDHSYIRRYATISDSLIIKISTDCGETWTEVTRFGEDGTGIFETHPSESTEYIPVNAEDWCDAPENPVCNLIDLTQWIGNNNVQIMFETLHRRGNGLFIDNITVSQTIDVQDHSIPASYGLNLFPNPGNKVFTLTSDKDLINPEVKIYTATGKLVYNKKGTNGSQWSVRTGELPVGFYLFRLISAEGTWDQKLIVK